MRPWIALRDLSSATASGSLPALRLLSTGFAPHDGIARGCRRCTPATALGLLAAAATAALTSICSAASIGPADAARGARHPTSRHELLVAGANALRPSHPPLWPRLPRRVHGLARPVAVSHRRARRRGAGAHAGEISHVRTCVCGPQRLHGARRAVARATPAAATIVSDSHELPPSAIADAATTGRVAEARGQRRLTPAPTRRASRASAPFQKWRAPLLAGDGRLHALTRTSQSVGCPASWRLRRVGARVRRLRTSDARATVDRQDARARRPRTPLSPTKGAEFDVGIAPGCSRRAGACPR